MKIYNYLTKRKEEFKPLNEGYVTIYVCGPTVYSDAHIGHAKVYVLFDVIVRYLRYLGYKVKYVQNITDVGHLLDTGEDRILYGAKIEKIDPMELVEKYTRRYFEDMDSLNIIRPNISPRASAHIPEQIEIIEKLIEKSYAYEVNGSVYFSVEKFKEYGNLSGRKIEEDEIFSRVKIGEKKHPADFALWIKAKKEHLMQWNSPWGRGYPGWHIECTAMILKYLGETIDIHGGGLENIFPHNECEIAQAKALTGKQFVMFWVLVNTLRINGVKMSKSLGNVVRICDAINKFSPEEIRFFLLTTHYRSVIDWTEENVNKASEGLKHIHLTFYRLKQAEKQANEGEMQSNVVEIINKYKEKFLAYMDDDFNTPLAIGVVFDLSREINKYLDSGNINKQTVSYAKNIYEELCDKILGILPFYKKAIGKEEKLIEIIINLRNELRKRKEWEMADKLRAELNKIGIILEDDKELTRWRYK